MVDGIYGDLERSSLLQNEQKGCRRGFRGAKDQLLISNIILSNCRKASRNLAIEFADSVRHGAYFLIKRDTKNRRSG